MSAAVVDTRELLGALEWVAKAVPNRPSIPVLGGIRIQFTADNEPADHGPGVTLTAFDYETSHTAHVHGTVTEAGEVLVPGLLARDLVATMKGESLSIDAPDRAAGVVLRSGRTNVTLPELPLADYPTLPGEAPTIGRIQAAALLGLCRTTWWAAGRDEMLPVLTGVHLVGDDEHLVAETTNRFVISRRRLSWDPKRSTARDGFTALAPGRQLGVAAAGLEGWVDIGFDGRLLRLTTDTRTVTLRVLEGEFPKLDKLWPAEDRADVALEISCTDLVGALTRARIALEPNQACQVRVTGDTVEIDGSGKGAIAGTAAADVVDAVVTGLKDAEVFEQGFNPLFLADAVNSLGGDTARVWLTAGNKPAAIRGDGDSIAALVMPRRVVG